MVIVWTKRSCECAAPYNCASAGANTVYGSTICRPTYRFCSETISEDTARTLEEKNITEGTWYLQPMGFQSVGLPEFLHGGHQPRGWRYRGHRSNVLSSVFPIVEASKTGQGKRRTTPEHLSETSRSFSKICRKFNSLCVRSRTRPNMLRSEFSEGGGSRALYSSRQ